MKKIYIFSGLGTDERVLKNIEFPGYYEVEFIKWPVPYNYETLQTYAKRITEQINTKTLFCSVFPSGE